MRRTSAVGRGGISGREAEEGTRRSSRVGLASTGEAFEVLLAEPSVRFDALSDPPAPLFFTVCPPAI